jgi:hypothetical protein
MRTFYICESGVKPCEQPEYTLSPDFVSFTLISASLQDIWSNWERISHSLAQEWPTTIKEAKRGQTTIPYFKTEQTTVF